MRNKPLVYLWTRWRDSFEILGPGRVTTVRRIAFLSEDMRRGQLGIPSVLD